MKTILKYTTLALATSGILLLSACSTTSTSTSTAQEKPTVTKTASTQDPGIKAADVSIELGIAYLEKGNVSQAKQNLLNAVKQAPKYPPSWYTLAYYYEVTGEKDQANDFYQKSLKLAPNDGNVLNNYGTYLCRSQQYKESIPYFLKAVKDPDYLSTAEAYENAGLCAMAIPDLSQAKTYFQRALQQSPGRTTSILELAEVNYQEKNYAFAKQGFDSYNQLEKTPSPESLWLGVRLGWTLKDKTLSNQNATLLAKNYPTSAEANLLAQAQQKMKVN